MIVRDDPNRRNSRTLTPMDVGDNCELQDAKLLTSVEATTNCISCDSFCARVHSFQMTQNYSNYFSMECLVMRLTTIAFVQNQRYTNITETHISKCQ